MKSIAGCIVMVLALFPGCTDNQMSEPTLTSVATLDGISVEVPSVYHYTALNRAGAVIVSGRLSFSFSANGRVTGRWELRAADTVRSGPQYGRGRLSGTFTNGTLSVNLNPGMVDNNVLLNGRFDRTSYSGRWEWVGFPGVLNGGTFRAARIRNNGAAEETTD